MNDRDVAKLWKREIHFYKIIRCATRHQVCHLDTVGEGLKVGDRSTVPDITRVLLVLPAYLVILWIR